MNAFRHFREQEAFMAETIIEIPLDELHPFPDHPFGVRDDDMMQQTVESIREYGVIVPGIARPREDGGYEIVSGHRRKHACELASLKTMPFIIRDIDRNTATIIMVDSNLQRENILPSEKAKAYKMKLEAIKRRAGRPGRNSVQVGQNYEGKTSREQIAENSPDSATQIQRYIRLTELEPELLQMVDEGKIGMTPAVEISYLNPDEQKLLIETIDSEQATPSLSQAQRMKRLSKEGKLSDDAMLGIMTEQKKPETWDLKLPMDKIRKYFPRSYTPQRMEETIIKLLETWMKKRQRDHQR
jgi:ParB family chromosome partitioning protein